MPSTKLRIAPPIAQDDSDIRRRRANDAHFDLLDYVPYLINRVAVGMVHYLARDLERFKLNIQKWRILAALLSHGECRFGDLAKITSIEVPTLSRIVARMQRDRLIRCRPLESDSRTFLAALTPKGRTLAKRVLPRAFAAEAAMIEGLSPQEIAAFKQTLRVAYENLGRPHPSFDKRPARH
jgi:DNA-binding MarR family transcriptional regulator